MPARVPPPSGAPTGVQEGDGGDGRSIRSVDRAVSVLQLLAERGECRVSELAVSLGVNKSSAFRLLTTLEARGLVEQVADRGRYRLAYGVVRLAAGAARRMDLSLLSRSTCQTLAEDTGETVCIALREGGAVVTIDQVLGRGAVTTVDWIGQRSPLHATAAGKVFLAALDETGLREELAHPLERFTDATITEPAQLRAELETVRARGYASTRDEHEVGLSAIGVPILDGDRRVVGALTVSGPTFRLPAGRVADLAALAAASAARISRRNGLPDEHVDPRGGTAG